jgi:spore maturation protein CgeB
MKVLLLGSVAPGSLESFYLKYLLNRSDFEVKVYACHDVFYSFHRESFFNKILLKAGLSSVYKKINSEIISIAEEFKPDILLVFKGMEVYVSTLTELKNRGIKLVNYNPDHPFIFFGRGSGNKNVERGIEKYDLYLTYSDVIASDLVATYKVKTGVIPFGYNYLSERPVRREEEINKICFIGNPDRERAEIIKYLSDNDLPVDVYGQNWNSWLSNGRKISVFDSVYEGEFLAVANKYRIGLNLFRPHNNGSHNMRSFEMLATGTIQLLPYSKQQEIFFEDEKEVFYYRSKKDLVQKAKSILALPFELASEIKSNAIAKSTKGKFSYKDRTVELLNYLTSL